MALTDAPKYELKLSNAHGDPDKIKKIAADFNVIAKDNLAANPNHFDEAIRKKWKISALPAALDVLVNDGAQDLLQLVRKGLPNDLGIEDEEILQFFRALKSPDAPAERPKELRKPHISHLFPEDWQKLLDSFEPEYERARQRFREGYYRKFAQYLIGDQYVPWSKSTTWRHIGVPNITEERKRLGNVISLFKKWHFIEDAERPDLYQRVEKSVTYLQKLFG